MQYSQASFSVCWFLITLILFNLAYVLAPGASVKLALPSVLQLAGLGFFLGVLQGIIFVYHYSAQWVNIGVQLQGGLPFDIAFFAAGCIAKRNGWLDAIKTLSARQFWLARSLALAVIICTGLVCALTGPNSHVVCATSSGPAEHGISWLAALLMVGFASV